MGNETFYWDGLIPTPLLFEELLLILILIQLDLNTRRDGAHSSAAVYIKGQDYMLYCTTTRASSTELKWRVEVSFEFSSCWLSKVIDALSIALHPARGEFCLAQLKRTLTISLFEPGKLANLIGEEVKLSATLNRKNTSANHMVNRL